ncbi:acetylxylan esterase [Devosia sp. CN2-171]|jgi:cephalosporin-C deacetylase|uniref:acetylxylan esterase n=1 Tax=Devosia sp. CN2-171 TaxID=3400909 RepID=UPI003BF7809C
MPFFDLPQSQLETYRSSAVAPADFDSFWAETLSTSRAKPLDAVFEPVDVGLKLFDVFDVTFSGFNGDKIKGWYIKPAGVAPRGTVVKFIGYGGGRALPHEHLLWPATGRALLVMDTRGQGSSWSRGDTPDPAGSFPAHPGFMTRGINDPHDYYYRRVYTDGVRAVDVALSRPETDPNKLAVVGGSQGGGIAIAVAGLHPGVKAAMPDVPFLQDFPRAVGLTTRDPYGEIVRYLGVHREKAAMAYNTINYFDGVHFAARCKAATLYSVALMDDVCPPSTVYASFNAWAGPKTIEQYNFNNHEGGGTWQEKAQVAWLDRTMA